jgi:pyruvate formate lyase activating enzyme
MRIHGLQKMSLVDYPGKVACTVFLGGCDFRCPYCHNAELLSEDAPAVMDDAELLDFLKKRQGLLDGVVITGGEPLLRKDLPDLLRRIKELGYPIKLDTDGNHPKGLKEVVGAGLVDYVAMDVKNSPERYGETIGIPAFNVSRVDESIHFLLEGNVGYEFRTTVVKQLHDEESFKKIGEWIKGADHYFLQKFVDRDTVPFAGLTGPSDEEMSKYLDIIRLYVPSAELRGI